MDAYQSWTLFLIFCSMIVLVSGVVLLTYKKPEDKASAPSSSVPLSARGHRSATKTDFVGTGRDEEDALHEIEGERDDAATWQLGEASDEDEDSGTRSPRSLRSPRIQRKTSAMSLRLGENTSQANLARSKGSRPRTRGDGEEASMLAAHEAEEEEETRSRGSTSSDATLARPDTATFVDEPFGAWEDAHSGKAH